MKKATLRFLGIICAITFFSQFSATRVDSLTPVFIGIAAMIGAIICFSVSDDLHE